MKFNKNNNQITKITRNNNKTLNFIYVNLQTITQIHKANNLLYLN